MNRKPRILIIDNSPQVTGALKSVAAMAQYMGSAAEFIFLLPAGSRGIAFLERQGVKEIYTCRMVELSRRIGDWLSYPFALLRNALMVRRLIKTHRIDMIHANDLYNLIPPVVRLLDHRIKYVVYVRLLRGKFPAIIFDSWVSIHLWLAEAVICVSRRVMADLPANSKVTQIYDPLPLAAPTSLPVRQDVILYLSNLIRGKGQDLAIEVFAQLQDDFPDMKLKFVGSDMGLAGNRKFREELLQQAIRRGVADKILWQDFSTDVATEFQSAKMAINFSESESFSMTCLEALYYGCPLVATNSGGPAEIIDDGQSGFLVPFADINEMTRAVRSLLGNSELRESFSREGKARVRSRFAASQTSEKLLECYLNVLR